MKVTWTLSLIASILASGFILCLSDQDVASEIHSTSRTIHRNRQDVLLQDFPATTTAHLAGPSVMSDENYDKARYGNDHESNYRAYSRPRSLLFTNDDAYVFVDVSDQFSYHGKLYVSVLFLAFWVLSIIPRFKKRAAIIRLMGAVLMVGLRHLMLQSGHGPRFQIENLLFWKPLVVQFGLMLVTIGLENTTEHGGLVQKMGDVLESPVPWKRCRNILFLATVGSAFLSRDLTVFLFSGVVVDLCIRHNVDDPMPYLLSLSTAANIGSSMTLTGTFSNLLVSTLAYDPISWSDFTSNLVLPTVCASTINVLLIMLFYPSELFHGPRGNSSSSEQVYEMVGSGEDAECNESPCEYMAVGEVPQQRQWSLWSILQLACVGFYMICFAMGLNIGKVSMGAGVCMMILHLCNRMYYQGSASMCQGGSAAPANNDDDGDQVATTRRIPFDYGILVTHLAQFLLVGSLSDTGVPQTGFYLSLGRDDGCAEQITSGLCLYRFVTIIAAMSIIFSSASIVQMCAATFPYATPYDWVQVSFAANMSGNLGMYGSSAHYTVGDQFARATGKPSPVSIRSYVLFAHFHSALECSYRLGECDEIWHG